jgi:hypothetical protein
VRSIHGCSSFFPFLFLPSPEPGADPQGGQWGRSPHLNFYKPVIPIYKYTTKLEKNIILGGAKYQIFGPFLLSSSLSAQHAMAQQLQPTKPKAISLPCPDHSLKKKLSRSGLQPRRALRLLTPRLCLPTARSPLVDPPPSRPAYSRPRPSRPPPPPAPVGHPPAPPFAPLRQVILLQLRQPPAPSTQASRRAGALLVARLPNRPKSGCQTMPLISILQTATGQSLSL